VRKPLKSLLMFVAGVLLPEDVCAKLTAGTAAVMNRATAIEII
jgi:hypothetical protein